MNNGRVQGSCLSGAVGAGVARRYLLDKVA
jgi:hypothetical protein